MKISCLRKRKVFPSYTLTATICGYIFGIICIPKYISQVTTFSGYATILVVLLHPAHNIRSLARSRFSDIPLTFNLVRCPSWDSPNSWVWAVYGLLLSMVLGDFTKLGASVMIMGLCGNAVMPLCIWFIFADVSHSVRLGYWSFVSLLLCTLIFYAFSWSPCEELDGGQTAKRKKLFHEPA
jgi:fucose permease